MKNIHIRKATAGNLDQFYPFFKKCIDDLFLHYTTATRAFFFEESSENVLKKELTEKNKSLYLALEGSRPVGFLLARKVYGGVGSAVWLAVDPEFQNQGIASSLLSLWENDTLHEGGHAVEIWTTKKNIPFYKKRGFTLIGEFPQAWFGANYYHFYKSLAKPVEKNYLKEYLVKRKNI